MENMRALYGSSDVVCVNWPIRASESVATGPSTFVVMTESVVPLLMPVWGPWERTNPCGDDGSIPAPTNVRCNEIVPSAVRHCARARTVAPDSIATGR